MKNKTLFQIEQRIKKGCGKDAITEENHRIICGDRDWNNCYELCPSCQREEDLIQEIKGIVENCSAINIPKDIFGKYSNDFCEVLLIRKQDILRGKE